MKPIHRYKLFLAAPIRNPVKFSGAVLVESAKPLELIERVEVPILKEGQVLVKVHYAGVCHSQLMEQQGLRGKDKFLPHFLGHEATATVIDVGQGVSKVKTDDKVVLGWLKGEGMDVAGAIYDSPIGKINSGPVTTFSEYTVVSENRCYVLPENLSMKEGVLLGCALPTGMGIVKNQMQLNSETTLGIVGLGGIGLAALNAASCLPHKKLIAIDTNDEKLRLAKSWGASHVVNPMKENVQDSISNITSGEMLDYVVEAAGKTKTIELGFSLIKLKSGHCIFASHPAAGEKIEIDPFELICGKKITGSWGGCSNPDHMCDFVSENKSNIDLNAFLSSPYTLSEINNAFQDLSQQKVLRALIEISPT